MDHRPISEQFLGTTNINSVSLTHDSKHSASSGSPGFPRPNSEVFGTQHKPSAEGNINLDCYSFHSRLSLSKLIFLIIS
jgi:hypothetical protein